MNRILSRVFLVLLTLVVTTGLIAQDAPSLLAGIAGGAVRAEFSGTGGSSGDSVKVRVSKGPKAVPGSPTYSVPPGSKLASSDGGAQSMTILGVAGEETGPGGYSPTSVITVPATGSKVYILQAFCAEFHKENPSESTRFALQPPDKVMTCIARQSGGLSIDAKQAAVWMYTDDATFREVNEKFDVSAADWAKAEIVYKKCQPPVQ